MELPRIKILKDTPFDKEGIELDLTSFRMKYGWICTSSTTNEQLLTYIQDWEKYPKTNNTINVGEWFKVIQYHTESLPLQFIYEGILYVKQYDGTFHKFVSGACLKKCNSIGICTIHEATLILQNAKYHKHILYITEHIDKKL
jgi:hypothetical protein